MTEDTGGPYISLPAIESSPSRAEVSPEPALPPSGLQKLPNLWKYLTRDARPADPDSAGVDVFGNPLEPMNRRELDKTEEEPRSSFIDDAAPFDAEDVFTFLPPDIQLDHYDQPIVESFSENMSQHGMTVTQVHEAIRWANGYQGDNLEKDFAAHMSEHGVTAGQAREAKKWFDGYAGSEAAKDDAALAKCEQALTDIQALMGTDRYWKDEKMQADHLKLIEILCDGDE